MYRTPIGNPSSPQNIPQTERIPQTGQTPIGETASPSHGVVSTSTLRMTEPTASNQLAGLSRPPIPEAQSSSSSSATVQGRLDEWVNSAPTEEEKQIRRDIAIRFQNDRVPGKKDDGFLKVRRGVDLHHYRGGLTSLPANLYMVQGGLHLRRCTGLTALPDSLKEVRRHLDLSYCTSLRSLPDGLRVGGDIDLSYCTSLENLPEWIFRLGARNDGRLREVNLFGCSSLPEAVCNRLRNMNTPGVRYHAPIIPTQQQQAAQRQQRVAQANNLSWENLSLSSQQFDEEEDICAISLEPLKNLNDPICLERSIEENGRTRNRFSKSSLYSLETFKPWWTTHGTDPATRLEVAVTDICAVRKRKAEDSEDSPSSSKKQKIS